MGVPPGRSIDSALWLPLKVTGENYTTVSVECVIIMSALATAAVGAVRDTSRPLRDSRHSITRSHMIGANRRGTHRLGERDALGARHFPQRGTSLRVATGSPCAAGNPDCRTGKGRGKWSGPLARRHRPSPRSRAGGLRRLTRTIRMGEAKRLLPQRHNTPHVRQPPPIKLILPYPAERLVPTNYLSVLFTLRCRKTLH